MEQMYGGQGCEGVLVRCEEQAVSGRSLQGSSF